MRYSLRRALSLDSVDGGTHNPTIRFWRAGARLVPCEEDRHRCLLGVSLGSRIDSLGNQNPTLWT